MGAGAGICILLTLAFGAAFVVGLFRLSRQQPHDRPDGIGFAALMLGFTLASFVLSIWFVIAQAAGAA